MSFYQRHAGTSESDSECTDSPKSGGAVAPADEFDRTANKLTASTKNTGDSGWGDWLDSDEGGSSSDEGNASEDESDDSQPDPDVVLAKDPRAFQTVSVASAVVPAAAAAVAMPVAVSPVTLSVGQKALVKFAVGHYLNDNELINSAMHAYENMQDEVSHNDHQVALRCAEAALREAHSAEHGEFEHLSANPFKAINYFRLGITGVLRTKASLSTTSQLLERQQFTAVAAELSHRKGGPFTFFAPNNAAWTKVGDAALTDLESVGKQRVLQTALLHHLVKRGVDPDKIVGGVPLSSAADSRYTLVKEGKRLTIKTINGGVIQVLDVIRTFNGRVFVIDQVLVPDTLQPDSRGFLDFKPVGTAPVPSPQTQLPPPIAPQNDSQYGAIPAFSDEQAKISVDAEFSDDDEDATAANDKLRVGAPAGFSTQNVAGKSKLGSVTAAPLQGFGGLPSLKSKSKAATTAAAAASSSSSFSSLLKQ